MVKANLCLFTGSKSFLPKIAGLAEERTPTRRSVNAKYLSALQGHKFDKERGVLKCVSM